MPQTNEGE
jgi:uncharacterized C2H2 Zn-finger protein